MAWWTSALEWIGVSIPSILIAMTAYTTELQALDPGWVLILSVAQIVFVGLYVGTDFADLSAYGRNSR